MIGGKDRGWVPAPDCSGAGSARERRCWGRAVYFHSNDGFAKGIIYEFTLSQGNSARRPREQVKYPYRVFPDSPPDMVGGCLVCFQGVPGCRPGVTHDMIGHRTGSRVPSLRVSAAVRCQLWLFSGQRRHGPAWQLGRVAYKPMLQAGSPYARYGSAASANILCRALSSNSYEGWPRARRMINLLA